MGLHEGCGETRRGRNGGDFLPELCANLLLSHYLVPPLCGQIGKKVYYTPLPHVDYHAVTRKGATMRMRVQN
jgi:hypothetical protein